MSTVNTVNTVKVVEEQVEVWQSAVGSRHWVRRFSPNGQTTTTLIAPHQKFEITPAERRLNQSMAASLELDLFANGTFVAVTLSDDTPDVEEIESNPNNLSDDDLRGFFKLHPSTFRKRIGELNNVPALQTLLGLCDDEDVKATVKQQEAIEARLEEISPRIRHRNPSVDQGLVEAREEGDFKKIRL